MPSLEQVETSSPIVLDHVFVPLANPVLENSKSIEALSPPGVQIYIWPSSLPSCREMYLHILTSHVNAEGG